MAKKKKDFGEIGEERNAILWWILCIIVPLGICTYILAYLCWKEIKEFNKRDINPVLYVVLMLIPIVNLVMWYLLMTGIKDTQERAGVPGDEQINPIVTFLLLCCFGIGIIVGQSGMNKAWKYAEK